MEHFNLSEAGPMVAVVIALALGGILKGATGAGLPLVAIPVIATVYDVRMAVSILVIPNLINNLLQVNRYRAHSLEPGFARNLALSAAVGAVIGTFLLTHLHAKTLELIMAGIIVIYIVLRLMRPDLKLALPLARKLVWPAGFAGGILQGAAGISAPIGITFLNSMRLPRPVFILTVSCFFAAMSASQLVSQVAFGVMTAKIALLGLLALIPMTLAMPLGEKIGRRVSAALFDKIMLVFLAVVAIRAVL